MAGGVCKYFLQGKCQYGNRCRYSHSGATGGSGSGGYGNSGMCVFSYCQRFLWSFFTATRVAGRQSDYSNGNDRSKVCQHYLRGTCTFGDRCKFSHVSQQRTGPTYAQYGQQQPRDNVCKYYINGTCRYGDSCKFEHPSSGWSSGRRMHGTLSGALQVSK